MNDLLAEAGPGTAVATAEQWCEAARRGDTRTLVELATAEFLEGDQALARIAEMAAATATGDDWAWLVGLDDRVVGVGEVWARLVDPGPGVEAVQRAPQRDMPSWNFRMVLIDDGWRVADLLPGSVVA